MYARTHGRAREGEICEAERGQGPAEGRGGCSFGT